jgi:uncharacterized delta-60 repeat protein
MRSLIPAAHVAAFSSFARATSRATKAALFLFSVAVLLAGGTSAAPGQSALDGFDPNANGAVNVVVVQPDGKILLGGDFTTLSPNGGAAVTRNRIARLNPDGTLDTAFNPNANAAVRCIAVQADGKILVGGQFTGTNSIGGQTRNYIARLDAATGEADSFDPNANGTVRSIAVQADGKILVGGGFFSMGGQTRVNIARLDATTGLADSFNPNADHEVFSIAVQADGKILLGGRFGNIGGQPRYNIGRLDPVTGHADSFDPNTGYCCGTGMDAVYAIAAQADGKVLIGGSFTSIGGQQRRNIARVDATTGQPDSFNPNANDYVSAIAVQADGRILVGGNFTSIGGEPRNHIARLSPVSGAADSFAAHTSGGGVHSIAVQADGKILAGGDFTAVAPNGGALVTRNRIARLEADGRLDQTLNLNALGSEVYATTVQADGKILIGGNFTSVLGVPRNHIARLNRDGTLDATFDPNADSIVYAIATQADGKILVGGSFTGIGGQIRFHMARLDPLTGLPDSFDPNANDDVLCMAVQVGDRRILVGGQFTTIGGQMRNRIARLDPDTGLADQFNPNANGTVRSITPPVESNHGQLSFAVGGAFTNIGGQMRNHIAGFQGLVGGGAFVDSFNPNVQGQDVYVIEPHENGLLVGGLFTSIGGQPRNNIARVSSDGTADSFDPNANNGVSSIVLQADGKILVGGAFNGANSIGGQARNRVARLDPDTGQADSFDPNANDIVYSLALQPDGKVLAGGLFTSIGGEPRTAFARLSNDTAALQELIVTQHTVTWTRGGSSPQFTRVFFSLSTDNLNYTPLGQGFRYPQTSDSNWIWSDPYYGFLPAEQNIHIQARGYYGGGYFNSSESITDSVRNVFLFPGARPLNLSTRMRVGTGDNVGIGGFIIKGTTPPLVFDYKHVLIRAVGASFDQLVDPVLELHSPDPYPAIINDNWRDDPLQEMAILATGLAPSRDLDSAIDAYLQPGSYTVVVRGKNNSSGVGLIEIYDLDQPVPTKLANISTRAFVGTNSNIVIAGFILAGNGANDRIVVRGIGPSLTAFGVPNALADPTLELRDSNGVLLIANNDWQDNPDQAGELTAVGLAPTSPLESGIAATLSPGVYTALLAGQNNGTGIGLVEVYDLGAP